jgi:hypothetical protein
VEESSRNFLKNGAWEQILETCCEYCYHYFVNIYYNTVIRAGECGDMKKHVFL